MGGPIPLRAAAPSPARGGGLGRGKAPVRHVSTVGACRRHPFPLPTLPRTREWALAECV